MPGLQSGEGVNEQVTTDQSALLQRGRPADPALSDTGPHNLIAQVFEAIRHGRAPRIFGDDYPTADGTCIRDDVDVEDVANAHVRAAEALEQQNTVAAYDVGVGTGSSVLQVLEAIRLVSGHSFEAEILPRRPGDPARIVGQVDLIAKEIGLVGHPWAHGHGPLGVAADNHREALQAN